MNVISLSKYSIFEVNSYFSRGITLRYAPYEGKVLIPISVLKSMSSDPPTHQGIEWVIEDEIK